MAYDIPNGYTYDENTGLYYTQVIAESADGSQSQVVTWFDADSGKYRQEVYPIPGSVRGSITGKTSQKRPGNVKQSHTQDRMILRQPPKVDTTGDIGYMKNKNFMRGLIAVVIFCLIMVAIVVLIFKFLSGDLTRSSDTHEKTVITDNIADTSQPVAITMDSGDGDKENREDITADPVTDSATDERSVAALIPEEVTEKITEDEEPGDAQEDDQSREEYGGGQYKGMFISSDFDIPRAFAPVLYFKDDHSFEMMLNFSEGTQMYYGNYSEEAYPDSGIIYLNLYGYERYNGLPAQGKVMFNTDNYDTCWFMNEGFGLMGYQGAPYEFYRDTRQM